MRFSKMQAYGNDFVFMTFFGKAPSCLPSLARFCCDRRRGIGADGYIVICGSETCDIMMRVFNPDGSEAEMCGNALRCSAALLRIKGITCSDTVTVETRGGIRGAEILSLDGNLCIVKGDMGIPTDVKSIENARSVRGKKFELTALSLGNPHIAAYAEDVNGLDIKKYGPALEKGGYFPNGANVHFYSLSQSGVLAVRSWERACGETLSCATGAAAAFTAARLRGLCGERAYICHPGGKLLAETGDGGRVFTTGETRLVYEGELSPESVL